MKQAILALVLAISTGYSCTNISLPNGDLMTCCGDEFHMECF